MLNKKKEIKFIAKLSKQGEKKIIIVPMANHKDVEELLGKSIKVTIEDAID